MSHPGRNEKIDLILVLARIFLATPFILFGIMKARNLAPMQAFIEAGGLPGEVIWLVIPLQILGGLAVVFGWHARVAAVLLAGFCLLAASLYHNHWSDLGELASFTKDLATAGGFLFLAVHGPGQWSLDSRAGRLPATPPA